MVFDYQYYYKLIPPTALNILSDITTSQHLHYLNNQTPNMSSPASEYDPDQDYSYIEEAVKIEEQEVPKTRKSSKGRKLLRWSRKSSSSECNSPLLTLMFVAEKDQLVLLCIEYIVGKEGVDLDWDAVAKEVEGFATGEAIKQHLSKLRAARVNAGQKVPPKLDRKTIVAARKKINPLLDAGKTPKTPKRRVKKNDDDEWDGEEEAPKPAPKTSGLLHFPPTKSTPRKRKIKQEPDEEMGCMSSKPEREEETPNPPPNSTPSKKKKKSKSVLKPALPPNFPPEEPPLPADDGRGWSPGAWNPQGWQGVHGAGGGDEGIVPLQRARGGTFYNAPPPGLTFGGDGALPDPFPGAEDAVLPSPVGGDFEWDRLLDGSGFGGLFGTD